MARRSSRSTPMWRRWPRATFALRGPAGVALPALVRAAWA